MDLALFESFHPRMQALLGVAALVVFAVLVGILLRLIACRIAMRIRANATLAWLQAVLSERVARRAATVVPPLIVLLGIPAVPELNATLATVIGNVALAIAMLQIVRTLLAIFDSLLGLQQEQLDGRAARLGSIKNYVQLGKLVVILMGAVTIIAALVDRSPLILLSGLGAMSAVLMLVFKDTILSFTAGVQLSSNDMLRVGDWIEMPQLGADGAVIDIALHTVKVQNWDRSITSIPTWRLMSDSYRNWRGMSESGGRRIKRTLSIDASTIHFLDDAELQRLHSIELLRPYLQDKQRDLHETNVWLREQLGESGHLPVNQRRLTNLGTFRAYVKAYLQAHPRIHQQMSLMVRALQPTSEGVPLELYCFTATTVWVEYEGIQSDIFDHLLAILPEFGLKLYQRPAGSDVRLGAQALAAA